MQLIKLANSLTIFLAVITAVNATSKYPRTTKLVQRQKECDCADRCCLAEECSNKCDYCNDSSCSDDC